MPYEGADHRVCVLSLSAHCLHWRSDAVDTGVHAVDEGHHALAEHPEQVPEERATADEGCEGCHTVEGVKLGMKEQKAACYACHTDFGAEEQGKTKFLHAPA